MLIKGPFYLKNLSMEDFYKNFRELISDNNHHLIIVQGPIISSKRKMKKESLTNKTETKTIKKPEALPKKKLAKKEVVCS